MKKANFSLIARRNYAKGPSGIAASDLIATGGMIELPADVCAIFLPILAWQSLPTALLINPAFSPPDSRVVDICCCSGIGVKGIYFVRSG